MVSLQHLHTWRPLLINPGPLTSEATSLPRTSRSTEEGERKRRRKTRRRWSGGGEIEGGEGSRRKEERENEAGTHGEGQDGGEEGSLVVARQFGQDAVQDAGKLQGGRGKVKGQCRTSSTWRVEKKKSNTRNFPKNMKTLK